MAGVGTAMAAETTVQAECLELQLWPANDANGGQPIACETLIVDSDERDALFAEMREMAARASERYAARLRLNGAPTPASAPQTADGPESDGPQAVEKTAADAGGGASGDGANDPPHLWHRLLDERCFHPSLMRTIPAKDELFMDARRKVRTALGVLAAASDAVEELHNGFGDCDADECPEVLAFGEARDRIESLKEKLYELDDELRIISSAFGHSHLQDIEGVTWERIVTMTGNLPRASCRPTYILRAAVGHLARAENREAIVREFEQERLSEVDRQFPDARRSARGERDGWPWVGAAEEERLRKDAAHAASGRAMELLRKVLSPNVEVETKSRSNRNGHAGKNGRKPKSTAEASNRRSRNSSHRPPYPQKSLDR